MGIQKGIDFVRNHGNNGYVLHIDIKRYYPIPLVPSDINCILNGVLGLLEEQPVETPEKHGHWIHSSSTEPLTVSCSNCGYEVNHFLSTWQTARYCPMCGAKMEDEIYETNRR